MSVAGVPPFTLAVVGAEGVGKTSLVAAMALASQGRLGETTAPWGASVFLHGQRSLGEPPPGTRFTAWTSLLTPRRRYLTLDTPGRADGFGQAAAALSCCDGALLVVSAAKVRTATLPGLALAATAMRRRCLVVLTHCEGLDAKAMDRAELATRAELAAVGLDPDEAAVYRARTRPAQRGDLDALERARAVVDAVESWPDPARDADGELRMAVLETLGAVSREMSVMGVLQRGRLSEGGAAWVATRASPERLRVIEVRGRGEAGSAVTAGEAAMVTFRVPTMLQFSSRPGALTGERPSRPSELVVEARSAAGRRGVKVYRPGDRLNAVVGTTEGVVTIREGELRAGELTVVSLAAWPEAWWEPGTAVVLRGPRRAGLAMGASGVVAVGEAAGAEGLYAGP